MDQLQHMAGSAVSSDSSASGYSLNSGTQQHRCLCPKDEQEGLPLPCCGGGGAASACRSPLLRRPTARAARTSQLTTALRVELMFENKSVDVMLTAAALKCAS